MPETKYCFPKHQKLKKQKDIDSIFSSGIKITSRPFIVLYIISPATTNSEPLHFGISASKKKHPHAVDRNLIKRRGREAYRLLKGELQASAMHKQLSLKMMFIYTGRTILPYSAFEEGVANALRQLIETVNGFEGN